MKNVLFTTTALAALAVGGSAFAAGHSSGNFGIAGSTDVGYNDDVEGGIFQQTNIDIKASKETGAGYTISGHARLNLDWDEATGESTSVEFKNIAVATPVGTLEFVDDGDGNGASDTWYADRDGMAVDVQNPDGLSQLKWEGTVGAFGYAVDAYDLNNGVDDDFSVGLGGDFGPAAVGFGYDNNSSAGGNSAFAVSADFDAGIADVGVSYADNNGNTSIGLVASAEVYTGLTLGAYYAVNDPADDAYGVTVDYTTGGFTLAIDYNTGEGAIVDELEIDASYDLGNGVVLYAGHSDAAGEGYYVGAQIEIADGISATVAYSEADEIGGPEFKDGTSAYLSLTY